MLCTLPPGDTHLLSPVVLINLLGNLWENGAPAWDKLFAYPNAKLHLYGKQKARVGRKMGHYNVLASDVEQALEIASHIRDALSKR
jgi:5-(carboxyamino)imidazole ribonucleotide synthase